MAESVLGFERGVMRVVKYVWHSARYLEGKNAYTMLS